MLPQYLVAALVAGLAAAGPISLESRQAKLCTLVGTQTLPKEVQDAADNLASKVTCDPTKKTIEGVPDAISGTVSFSSIDFSKSKDSSLTFALKEFATAEPLASSDVALFTDRLNVYVATEAGVRSVGGSLQVKAPKFFQSFQLARIKAASGVKETDPGQTVEHLLGKVIKNAPKGESAATLDAIKALATQLS
ncbi:hypothetical protein HYFRA_00001123 [Hymenoscyphus fraxineus]|uniref:DUF7143 domain-containing protein n=1 Tax=Hymenoscyphus fraxineus TaxID=746836 RepID=A0A9N9KRV7_9HELO|nr:hypothetical protein HYFRA_00001123 [Hymenoscyphus fraxineus]